jgi:hypothetical protein
MSQPRIRCYCCGQLRFTPEHGLHCDKDHAPVTPAPPEASHRALREIAEAADGGMAYALALMRGRLDVEVPTNADAIRAHITAIEALRAALSTGTGEATW